MKHYDVIVIGAGPGGIFATYELIKKQPNLSIAVIRKKMSNCRGQDS